MPTLPTVYITGKLDYQCAIIHEQQSKEYHVEFLLTVVSNQFMSFKISFEGLTFATNIIIVQTMSLLSVCILSNM